MKHAREDYNRIQDPENKIPANEPVFLIRGQDSVAPQVLRFYAHLAEKAGASRNLIDATMSQATAMEMWQADVARKTPDMP